MSNVASPQTQRYGYFLPQSLQVELVFYILRRHVIAHEHRHVDWEIGHGT